MSIRSMFMDTFVSERFRITDGIQKIMEASGGDSAKSSQTDVSGIIKRGFLRAVIIKKYMIINGRLSNSAIVYLKMLDKSGL